MDRRPVDGQGLARFRNGLWCMEPGTELSFLAMFERGDLAGARAWIDQHPAMAGYEGYRAHPLLRAIVLDYGGEVS